MKKLLYVKSSPYKVNIGKYNVQVIGMCKELIKYGYDCDILFIDNYNHDEIIAEDSKTKCRIKILYRKGIKIWDTGIYPSILKKKVLDKYDVVISTEWDQIMTPLLALKHNNVSMYSGPYRNTFRRMGADKIYNLLFRKIINNKVKNKIVKSVLAKKFLESMHYEDIKVVGVGLDVDKFKGVEEVSDNVKEITDYMRDNKSILFVGTLDQNKNVEFLLKVFDKISNNNPDISCIIIGNGDVNYYNECLNLISTNAKNKIKWYKTVNNQEMKNIYPLAEALVLPSKNEIFGMVMLEAMYFGCPVVSSYNGGSSTLIKDNSYGIVHKDFNVDLWADSIEKLIKDNQYRGDIIKNAYENISNNYTWENKAKEIIKIIEEKK